MLRVIQLRPILFAVFFAVAIRTIPPVLGAQTAAPSGSFSGLVLTDSGDVPIADAEISFPDQKLSARSDSKGNFLIGGLPPGAHALVIRKVGYEPYSATLTIPAGRKIEADIFLKPVMTKLANINVKAAVNPRYAIRLADFEERRRVGMGRFLTSDIFEKAEGQNMSQVLVSLIPGVRTSGKGSKQILVSRRSGKDCAAQVIVNGLVHFNGQEPNFDLNSLYTGQVIGVEYYTVANTPSQFNATAGSPGRSEIAGGSYCGTVVIWTK